MVWIVHISPNYYDVVVLPHIITYIYDKYLVALDCTWINVTVFILAGSVHPENESGQMVNWLNSFCHGV